METKDERSGIGGRLTASLISDAALIGGITILGYLTTYSYLSGQADALDIPIVLVSVSLETCLTVLAIILIFIMYAIFAVNFVMAAIPERLHTSALLRLCSVLLLTFVLILAAGAFINRAAYLFVILPILLTAYLLGSPFLEKKEGRNYFQRLNDRLERNAKSVHRRNPQNWLDVRLGFPVTGILIVPLFAVFVGNVFGRAEGQFNTHYFATLSRPPEILLARYGDVLVFRRLGTTTFIIRVVGKDQIPPLTETQTGSMAPVNKSGRFHLWEL